MDADGDGDVSFLDADGQLWWYVNLACNPSFLPQQICVVSVVSLFMIYNSFYI
jgi:hypothetical protein